MACQKVEICRKKKPTPSTNNPLLLLLKSQQKYFKTVLMKLRNNFFKLNDLT